MDWDHPAINLLRLACGARTVSDVAGRSLLHLPSADCGRREQPGLTDDQSTINNAENAPEGL